MLTGMVEDSNGALALISKPAAKAAMARAANMPSKIGVNTPSAQIVGGNVLHLTVGKVRQFCCDTLNGRSSVYFRLCGSTLR